MERVGWKVRRLLTQDANMLVNFSWLVEDQLAGAGQIGGWNHGEELEADLGLLYAEGIRAVVSLTERPLETDKVEARNMAYLHLPVQDMSAPTLEDIITFVQFIDQAVDKGLPVVVHCSAGLGRTGTMLASYMVKIGSSTAEALAEIRKVRPGSVETPDQELAIYDYEVFLAKGISS